MKCLGNEGPFERLSTEILGNSKLAEAVIAFDGLHYGDFRTYAENADRRIVPINSLLRQAHGLFDGRLFVRALAVARIKVILERYREAIVSEPALRQRLSEEITRLREHQPDGPEESRVFDNLCSIV